jgi:hypothetical protein
VDFQCAACQLGRAGITAPGMSKQLVEQLLGQPTSALDSAKEWTYERTPGGPLFLFISTIKSD